MITLYVGESALNSLLVYIVSIIYHFVAQIMKLFVVLSEAEILDSSVYMQLVKNFYLILGVGMLFVIAFSLLKVMVDPESSKGTEETTGIIKKFITSILLLIFLPTIFSFAFSFQSAVVRQGTIGKIFGNNVAVTSDDLKSVGATMANSVFLPFFQPTEEFVENECNGVNDNECLKKIKAPNYIFKTALNDSSNLYETIEAVNSGKLSFAAYADYGDSIKEGDVSFNFILALFCGIFMIYVVFSFCLDLGLRYVKLLFYQVIAPIPLFFRIVPNSKISDTFNQWVKVTITCYLEVFIRLFIIYFGVWLCSVLLNEDNGIFRSNFASGDGIISLFANLVIVLSILTFMKQVPKLIGEAFGFDSSNMKLNIKQKIADSGLFAVAGVVGGAAISTVRNLRKFKGEFKGKSKAEKFTNGMRMLKGGAAGIIGGGYRGFKAGNEAKSFSEMKSGISSAVNETTAKQDERNDLFSRGGNTIMGGYKAKANDKKDSIKEFWLGSQEQANAKIKSYDELIGLNDSAKKSAKALVEKAKTMSEGKIKDKYGEDFSEKIRTLQRAELDCEVAKKQLDWAVDNGVFGEVLEEYKTAYEEAKFNISTQKKNAEDFLVEQLYVDKDTWDSFTSDLKVDLSDGRIATDTIRVKLQSPEFSSEAEIINAGITPDTVGNIAYKVDEEIPVIDENGEVVLDENGNPRTETKTTKGIKVALDNLEVRKGEIAKESAIYNETHKSSDNK